MKKIILQNKNAVKNIIILGLSYLTGLALSMTHEYRVTEIEVLLPCLIALAGVVYYKGFALCGKFFCKKTHEGDSCELGKECLTKWDIKVSCVVGFLFALTVVVGNRIDFYNDEFHPLPLTHILLYPFMGLFFSAVVMILFAFRDKWSSLTESSESECGKENASEKDSDSLGKKANRFVAWIKQHPFLSLWMLNLICYLPYFLTFFPGNCGNDTWLSLSMITGDAPWTNHHPILFTGAMMVVVKATAFMNSLTASLGVFTFIQMVSLAATLAYLGSRICKMKMVWPCKAFAVLMFALHPFVGMYSVYVTKDVYFSEIMIFLCLKIYDVIKNKGEDFACPKECVKLAVLFLLSCMLRNNGMYISVLMAVIFLILYRKYWKQILLIFVCAIGLFKVWQGPVFKSLDIDKQSFAEAASVPLQQIGYVLWEGKEFSQEDMAFLEELMPVEKVKEVYEPGYTDPYKFDEEFNDDFLNDNVGEFLKVWSHGLVPYFGEYVVAYLHQTLGYWHFGATNSISTQGCTDNIWGIAQIDVIENTVGISLEPVFEKAILAGRKAPILCVLGSMAMQMWMVCLLILQYVRSGRKANAIWLIPLVILWGTIMVATPAFCLLRYLYTIFLLWPFMVAEFFANK